MTQKLCKRLKSKKSLPFPSYLVSLLGTNQCGLLSGYLSRDSTYVIFSPPPFKNSNGSINIHMLVFVDHFISACKLFFSIC